MENIVIIDYGSGNLLSVGKMLQKCAAEHNEEFNIECCDNHQKIATADRLILPGVGAFANCIGSLRAVDGLCEAMHEHAIVKQKPFLGICVGMQLMADYGEEFVHEQGLKWIAGTVVPLVARRQTTKIPQMGWNKLNWHNTEHPIAEQMQDGDGYFYFVHSYHFAAQNHDNVIASCHYDGDIVAVIGRDNLLGFQFHPEKSQANGQRLLSNFLSWKV